MRYLAPLMLLASAMPCLAAAPEFWGDGQHDDSAALQALVDGCEVTNRAAPDVLAMSEPFSGRGTDIFTFVIHGASIRLDRPVLALRRSGVSWLIRGSRITAFGRVQNMEISSRDLLGDPLLSPCDAPTV